MLEQNAIDRAKIALGVRTDVDLAKTLNIAQSAVAGWRKRGMVPQEQAVKIAQMTGVSLDWLIFGQKTSRIMVWCSILHRMCGSWIFH